eukprot:m.5689 g.5689  ORF g.5689 m.5689 type:complete len:339 (+) comp5079_c0_seq1:316-1332(+)
MKLFVRNVMTQAKAELEIDDTIDIATLKLLCSDMIGMEAHEMQLMFAGRVCPQDATLASLLIPQGGTLDASFLGLSAEEGAMMSNALQGLGSLAMPARQRRVPMEELQQLLNLRMDPYQFSALKQSNPQLAEAIERNDLDVLEEILVRSREAKRAQQERLEAQRRRLAANPFDVEAQKEIEEEIRKQNVEEMRQHALEYMPESFATVTMLYINVLVNKVPLKAFVDSGAQMTIISEACAERCGLLRYVDERFRGVAVGVGRQEIIGRIHMYEIEVSGRRLPISFAVLRDQSMDLIFGLDMLKRHRCKIELDTNRLSIGTLDISTEFLPESEIPQSERT